MEGLGACTRGHEGCRASVGVRLTVRRAGGVGGYGPVCWAGGARAECASYTVSCACGVGCIYSIGDIQ